MSEFYRFAAENPLLTFFLAYLALAIVLAPFRAINRFLRHRNITICGWPPPHLDADGDFADKE